MRASSVVEPRRTIYQITSRLLIDASQELCFILKWSISEHKRMMHVLLSADWHAQLTSERHTCSCALYVAKQQSTDSSCAFPVALRSSVFYCVIEWWRVHTGQILKSLVFYWWLELLCTFLHWLMHMWLTWVAPRVLLSPALSGRPVLLPEQKMYTSGLELRPEDDCGDMSDETSCSESHVAILPGVTCVTVSFALFG